MTMDHGSGVAFPVTGFGGLVYTDSMSMDAVTRMVSPDEAAVRAANDALYAATEAATATWQAAVADAGKALLAALPPS